MKDMELKSDRIWVTFSRLSLINMLFNIVNPLASLVDIAFLGHLEDITQLGGVILSTIIFSYLSSPFIPIRASTNSAIAYATARKDTKEAFLIIIRSFIIVGLIGIFILCLQIPIQKISFLLLSGSDAVEISGQEYFYARIWETPAVLFNFVISGWLLGKGLNWLAFLTSLIGATSNIIMDYISIIKMDLGSFGAGISTAISQYLILLSSFIIVIRQIEFDFSIAQLKESLKLKEIKKILLFNGNLLIRALIVISLEASFLNLGAAQDVTFLAINGLLLQILVFGNRLIGGFEMATQTMVGYLRVNRQKDKLILLLNLAIYFGVFTALTLSFIPILFPYSLTILTNHTDIIRSFSQYLLWLPWIFVLNALSYIFDAYIIGFQESKFVRNGSLFALICGFLPLEIVFSIFNNNNILWLSLVMYRFISASVVLVAILKMNKSDQEIRS